MARRDPFAELQAHYARGLESARLDTPLGVVERERTVAILRRHLPPAPAVVADIGGGPGRYARLLAQDGYRVIHRDLVALHVEQAAAEADRLGLAIESAVGDARALELADGCVDAVLLLGPLYHLERRSERIAALREAARVVRPGGPVYVAAISRWAPRLHGDLVERLREHFASIPEQLATVERSGALPPLFPGSFSGYCHRPGQLRAELRQAGLEVVDLVGVEGLAFALADLEARMASETSRAAVLEAAGAVERVPELLGLSPHLLATGRRQGGARSR